MSVQTCIKAQVIFALALAACKPEPAIQGPDPTAKLDETASTTGPAVPQPEPGPQHITDPSPDELHPQVIAPGEPATTPTPTNPTPTTAPKLAAGKEPLPAALNPKVDASCGNDPGVGTPAKPFALKTPDGKDINLASHRGKVVLLNFWGTWCKPCLKELPEFDRLYRRYRKHGMVLIAIATDTEPEKVLEFATERKLAAKLALGGEPLAEQYASTSFPFSLVIDDKGQIRGSYRGYRPECAGKLELDLRTALERLP
ncbi:MAG: TlpA family protein disulfide reductase [Nannocystis sp.]|nr:TlpA disulfide reductase family protein [Nannocystis sp.]MBA3548027.1 TlpA family protein disulfide reductase [Nannocystis sp.]